MKSSTRLNSVVFQLTPTRTRCDLIIIANEKKEKIATGLLDPFLAHLKTAQDQIAKAGYSIVLEPKSHNDASWFTKGTVERFIRFVSTPEILERVHTIESEIIQIEEAITIQGKIDIDHGHVEDHQEKSLGSLEGNKSTAGVNEEKAIVLYEPGSHQPEESDSASQGGNSRAQLLKVLETRKSVLQKEQGMAFARAVAAGFDIDHMAPLVSFADCFGASRLRDASLRFMGLWKKKHETGQWLEIGATEAIASQPDVSIMNASGIVFSSEMASEGDGKLSMDGTAGERQRIEQQVPNNQQESFQNQFPQPMFPPWAMHHPPSALPLFQPYPVQGVPYYQAYSGNGSFYHPPYPPMEDPRMGVVHRTGGKRQSMDGDGSSEKSLDDPDWDNEDPQYQEHRKKAGRSRKRQSGKVVIRNINYISKAKNSSDSNSGSGSDSESNADGGDLLNTTSRSSKTKGSSGKFLNELNSYDIEEDTINEKETDDGHWLAFQNLLYREKDEDNHADKDHMFMTDEGVRRKQHSIGDDPIALGGRGSDDLHDSRINDIHKVSTNMSRLSRGSNDGVLFSNRGHANTVGQMDIQFAETEGRKVMSRTANDDFMVPGRATDLRMRNSLDPLAENGVGSATNKSQKTFSNGMADESFIVPFRSMTLDDTVADNRTAIDMDSELPATPKNTANNSHGERSQVNYEPSDLGLIPERDAEKCSSGYDPSWDYEMQVCVKDTVSQDKGKKEGTNNVKKGPQKSDKDRRPKAASDLDKKRVGGPIRKGKMAKTSPLEDARARAEKIRSFKTDIQKMKKEKEEEDLKRLEALKLERQKRIAARGSSSSARSAAPSSQTRRLPTKLSPSSVKGSKFSDTEPGSSSPLQRTKIRAPTESHDSQKASKSTKVSDGHLANDRLTRSASSLSDPNKESNGVTPDSKTSRARLRRLSEPKTISSKPVASVKAQRSEPVSKPRVRNSESASKSKLSDYPESKKISAIMDLDKKKAATLPELKIRTPKEVLDVHLEKSAVKDTMKVNDSGPSGNSESTEPFMKNRKLPHESEGDEIIVEKTVVMLESEKSSSLAPSASVENLVKHKQQSDFDDRGERTAVVSEYAFIDAPPSPFEGFVRDPIPGRFLEQLNSQEVGANSVEETPKFASIDPAVRPYYQAPYARVSSIEVPCTRYSEYAKAPPANSELASVEPAPKARVDDVKTVTVYNIQEGSEKAQVKEPSKGFKRLLKFAKKSQSSISGDRTLESDDNATSIASSSEVYTLKNLISQDEVPSTGNAVQKSRHFSLLSPFRSKTTEKKPAS
ncbi:PREDICTED: uncharacterized protein LOC109175643 isoform X2 [Ipomoea nil]|uniref:uncharacterized protein LOC109175643 isoform X2 n=1 Tax=Ipomoea nil TaxID=35883 RepID=UPI000901A85D|nr:PREDICTED: uncharacterized protein LOC109175643 isoform X2 [Ipomoea nil]